MGLTKSVVFENIILHIDHIISDSENFQLLIPMLGGRRRKKAERENGRKEQAEDRMMSWMDEFCLLLGVNNKPGGGDTEGRKPGVLEVYAKVKESYITGNINNTSGRYKAS